MKLPEPVLEEIGGGRIVVRDDLLPGGTKRRGLHALTGGEREELVYAGPVFGYAQIALAHAAGDAGKRATVFVAKRAEPHVRTLQAKAAGAKVMQVPFGRLNVVRARARAYCERFGAELLPFGLDDERFLQALAQACGEIRAKPRRVYVACGSGVLTRVLQRAFPEADHFAVRVGTSAGNAGRAEILQAPERFEDPAEQPPPFPSCSEYDAKVWRFFEKAPEGSLFWNVAA